MFACISGSRGIHILVERVGLLVRVRVERLARFTSGELELCKLPSIVCEGTAIEKGP